MCDLYCHLLCRWRTEIPRVMCLPAAIQLRLGLSSLEPESLPPPHPPHPARSTAYQEKRKVPCQTLPQSAHPTLLSLPIADVILHVQLFGSSKFLHSGGHCCTNGKQPQLETCPPTGVFFLLSSALRGSEQEATCEELWAQTIQLGLQRGDFCWPHSWDNRLRNLKSLPPTRKTGGSGLAQFLNGLLFEKWIWKAGFGLKFAQA